MACGPEVGVAGWWWPPTEVVATKVTPSHPVWVRSDNFEILLVGNFPFFWVWQEVGVVTGSHLHGKL